MSDEKLLKAAVNASNTLHAIYQWIDMIEAEGGAGSIAGVAKCHAFLTSMKKQRPRIDDLVMRPLEQELNARAGDLIPRAEVEAIRNAALEQARVAACRAASVFADAWPDDQARSPEEAVDDAIRALKTETPDDQ